MENCRILNSDKVKVMKTTNKYIICSALVLALCATVIFGYVYSTFKPASDPLEGWKDLGSEALIGCPFGQMIKDDYQNFIQNLPIDERSSVEDTRIEFYEKTDGQRAVKIRTLGEGFLSNIWWEHILIYDSNKKRIKTIRYKSGRSLS
jgi:hypothetical protein